MVKYIAFALVVVGSLSLVGVAEAGRRHGCASCGGCPGGYCGVPVGAPAAVPAYGAVAPPVVAAPQATTVVVASAPAAAQPAPAYYAARRGLFRRR
jgi:hypothetical protein